MPCMIRAYVYMMHVIVNDLGIGQEGARHEHGWHAYIYIYICTARVNNQTRHQP